MRVGLIADSHDRVPAIADLVGQIQAAGVGMILHAVMSLGEVEGIFADYVASRDRYQSDAAETNEEPLEAAEV